MEAVAAKVSVGTKRGISRRACKSIVATCSNKRKRCIPFLPDEIMFHILVWVPADILYNYLRYVCRQWYNIICSPLFIEEQLLRSTGGFLFHFKRKHLPLLVNVGDSNAHVTEVMKFPPFHVIRASCDGLVVVKHRPAATRCFYVANLITRQVINLPPPFGKESLVPGCRYKLSLVGCGGSSRNSSSSTSTYKVFISYFPGDSDNLKCAVIDVGKDRSWRSISCPNISLLHTLVCGGIIYWSTDRISVGMFPYTFAENSRLFLAFDVESETFYDVPSPALDDEYYNKVYDPHNFFKEYEPYYVEWGKSLSLFVRCQPKNVFDVWLVTDAWDPKSAFEWRKAYTITLDPAMISEDGVFNRRYPEAWANNGEVAVFRNRKGHFVAHNVKTGRTFKFGRKYGEKAGLTGFLSNFACSLARLSPC